MKYMLSVLLLLMIFPAIVSVVFILGSDYVTTEPDWIRSLEEGVLALNKVPVEIGLTITQVLPSIFGVVVLKNSERNSGISRFNLIVLSILFIGLVLALISLLFLDAQKYSDNISIGQPGEFLMLLIKYNSDIVKLTMVYALSIIGFSYGIENLIKAS